MKRSSWIAFIAVLGVAAAIICVAAVRQHARWAASLVSDGGQQVAYSDGRDVRILILGNANRRTAVVVVLHHGTPDPRRRVAAQGRMQSSDDPLDSLRSSVKWTTQYPPDPDVSGLWVDGRKLRVGDALTVVYVSDTLPATELAIPEADQATFLSDATSLDPLAFIDRWITPKLLVRP